MNRLRVNVLVVLGLIGLVVWGIVLGIVPQTKDTHALVEFMWPVYDHKISQGYSSVHKALDIQSNQGSVDIDVYSAADGVITFMGWDSYCDKNPPPTSCPAYLSGGNLIKISHPEGYETWYAHLESFAQDLAVGDAVWRGEYIGEMGNSGHYNGIPLSVHLHFELRQNGNAVNPMGYFTQKPYSITPRLESDVVISPNPTGDGSAVTATFSMGNAGNEGQPLLIDILFLSLRSPSGNSWNELGIEYEPDALIRKGEIWQFHFTTQLPSNEVGVWTVESVNLKVRHFGWFPVDLNAHILPTFNVTQNSARIIAGKSGRIVDHTWTWIPYDQRLSGENPILVANICSEYGVDNSHIDIKEVSPEGFFARVEEDLEFNGIHGTEEVCYIAVSEDAQYLSVRGSVSEMQIDPDDWHWFDYGSNFSSRPRISASIVTESGDHSVHVDLNSSTSGCQFRFEEDLHLDGVHYAVEKVDWIVWSDLPPGLVNGYKTGVNHNWIKINFPTNFSVPPVVIAEITSENGPDCAMADIRKVTTTSFEVRIEECLPCGDCLHHAGERVDWMAVEPGVLE